MAREKAITDEQIIAALLNSGTIKAAAAAVGMSERALYDRMSKGDFQAMYKAAKADLVRAAVLHLNQQVQAAIDTVCEIMSNEDNNAAVRLQAAQTILNNAGKFAQRLQADENSVLTQQESNKFLGVF